MYVHLISAYFTNCKTWTVNLCPMIYPTHPLSNSQFYKRIDPILIHFFCWTKSNLEFESRRTKVNKVFKIHLKSGRQYHSKESSLKQILIQNCTGTIRFLDLFRANDENLMSFQFCSFENLCGAVHPKLPDGGLQVEQYYIHDHYLDHDHCHYPGPCHYHYH